MVVMRFSPGRNLQHCPQKVETGSEKTCCERGLAVDGKAATSGVVCPLHRQIGDVTTASRRAVDLRRE